MKLANGKSTSAVSTDEPLSDVFSPAGDLSNEDDPFADLVGSDTSGPRFEPRPKAPKSGGSFKSAISLQETPNRPPPLASAGEFKLDPSWRKKETVPRASGSTAAGDLRSEPSVFEPSRPPAPAKEDSPVVAFLRGAGLSETTLNPMQGVRAMSVAGTIFRETVAGLISLLEAKRDFKEFMRADLTRLGTLINPLKAGFNVDVVMKAMLTEHELFMPSVDAVRDGLTQIKCHELALFAGMKSAVQQLVKIFDPDVLEVRVDEESTLGERLMSGRRARCWEAFKIAHDEISTELDEGQHSRLMAEFARAYNEQAKRCK